MVVKADFCQTWSGPQIHVLSSPIDMIASQMKRKVNIFIMLWIKVLSTPNPKRLHYWTAQNIVKKKKIKSGCNIIALLIECPISNDAALRIWSSHPENFFHDDLVMKICLLLYSFH